MICINYDLSVISLYDDNFFNMTEMSILLNWPIDIQLNTSSLAVLFSCKSKNINVEINKTSENNEEA